MTELFEYFEKGGVLMWVLLGCSVMAVAVIVERAVVYLAYGLRPDRWFDTVLAKIRCGQIAEASAEAEKCRHPVAKIVGEYLENLNRPAKVRLDNVRRRGSLLLEDVERRLRVLAAISHLAPLVGLLGTVVGMVAAFASIQALEGAAKPADLAGGIWEALLTTVFGLAVAIPCMAAFHAFESHADKIARRMELAVTSLDDVFSPAGDEGEDEKRPAAARAETEDWNSVG